MEQERKSVLFLSYQTRCHSVGIEYDERIFAGAEQNRENAVSGARTQFVLANAENYKVPSDVSFAISLIHFR